MKKLLAPLLLAGLLAAPSFSQTVELPGVKIKTGGVHVGIGWGLLNFSSGGTDNNGGATPPKLPDHEEPTQEWKDAESALKRNQGQIDKALDAGAFDAAEALAELGKVLSEVKRELAASDGDTPPDEGSGDGA